MSQSITQKTIVHRDMRVSPHDWDWLGSFLERRGLPGVAIAVATAAFSLFDVMGRRAYATFMSWSIITICFLVVIGAMYALRARRVA
mgnify:CR=1 FL=1